MKYAFITGAAGGLGLSASLALIKEGWTVFAADINEEALKKIKKDNYIPMVVDICGEKDIEKAYKEILKYTDHLDAIVNFAGIMIMGSFIETDMNKIERLMNINLYGMIRVNKILFPLVDKCKGRIVNISSETGWMSPSPFNGIYAMSKHAVEIYNDTLRRELMFNGIKVIKLQLGSFKTNMHDATLKSFAELKENTKLYKKPISKMGKMMDREMNQNVNDHIYMVEALIKALYLSKPKAKYRVKNSRQMTLINYLPEEAIDNLYFKSLS